jgi:hypothetical protein
MPVCKSHRCAELNPCLKLLANCANIIALPRSSRNLGLLSDGFLPSLLPAEHARSYAAAKHPLH